MVLEEKIKAVLCFGWCSPLQGRELLASCLCNALLETQVEGSKGVSLNISVLSYASFSLWNCPWQASASRIWKCKSRQPFVGGGPGPQYTSSPYVFSCLLPETLTRESSIGGGTCLTRGKGERLAFVPEPLSSMII